MKIIVLTILFLFSAFQLNAQDTAVVKKTAQLMVNSFNNGNYDLLLKYTYPKAIAIGGGREKMKSAMLKSIAEIKAGGMSFRSVSLGPVGKFYKAGKEIHCVIQQTQLMNVKGGYISAVSPLMGISGDGGKTWTFIHAGNMTPQKIKMLFPNFNNELVLQKTTPAVFHAE